MGQEISVSAVLVEQEDGTYKANCPELNINANGESSEEAFTNLKDAVQRHIRETGADKLQLNPVKCMKFKVAVD